MPEFQLKTQKNLNDMIYCELKHRILIGEIPAQTRLTEVELAKSMNVSRTPIRYAISRLAQDGLVQVEERKGAYVTDVALDDMLNLFEVREELEGFIAELAAKRIQENQKLELRHIEAQYEKSIHSGDKEKMIDYDEMFHTYIVKCCQNDALTQLVKYVQELSLRFRYLYYDDTEMYEDTILQHNRIMKALITADPELAKQEAKKHINGLKEFLYMMGQNLYSNQNDEICGVCE